MKILPMVTVSVIAVEKLAQTYSNSYGYDNISKVLFDILDTLKVLQIELKDK